MRVTLPCPAWLCEVAFEGLVKSQEQVTKTDVIAAGLLAAAVLRHAHQHHASAECKEQSSE